MASRFKGVLLGLSLLAGCGPEQTTTEPGTEPKSGVLTLGALSPAEVLPGTVLRLSGTGFPATVGTGDKTQLRLTLTGKGQRAGVPYDVKVDLPAKQQSATLLTVEVSDDLHKALAGLAELADDEQRPVEGELELAVLQDKQVFQRSAAAKFVVRKQFAPGFSGLSAQAVYLGDQLQVRGAGFLLPGEGQSVVLLEGNFAAELFNGQRDPGQRFVPYAAREFPLTPVSRTEAVLPVGANLLGIAPGTLVGKLTVINRHRGGAAPRTDAVDAQLALLRSQLVTLGTPTSETTFAPLTAISRGQRVLALGAGFLALDDVADTATVVRLSGVFTPKDAQVGAPTELTLLTDVLTNNILLFVPRTVKDDAGMLTGLGARAGRFVGSVTPVITRGREQQIGVALPCGSNCVIDIAPPKQVLYAKFLANFTEGLRRFGLRNVEAEIRAQALATARRTYASWNVEIRDSRPRDYDEFTTMEVGGPDPNGAGLFGLDNTDGLDRGNLRLNDYIGGFNAVAEVEGQFAFGGVFIESFLSFSPQSPDKNMLAVPEFDAIFGPFIPEFGGRPADRAELTAGARKAQLVEAVRALGTLIGNTLAHEFGHSLGMATTGSGSHNPTDEDRELMDAGLGRSFAERVEIGEFRDRPSGFNQKHRDYLTSILPKP